MGELNIILIGEGVTRWFFPVTLCILFIFNLFNLQGKCLKWMGLDHYSFENEAIEGKIEEGKMVFNEVKADLKKRGLVTSYHVTDDSLVKTRSLSVMTAGLLDESD